MAFAGIEVGDRPTDLLATKTGRRLSVIVNIVGATVALGLALSLAIALTTGYEAQAIALLAQVAVIVTLVTAPASGLLSWLALAPFGQLFNISMGHGLPDLGINRIAALSLLLLLIVQAAVHQRRLTRPTSIEWMGILFLFGLLLSVPASRLGIAGGLQIIFDNSFVPLLCFFFARTLLGSERGVRHLVIILALVGSVLGLIAMREQLTGQAVLSSVPSSAIYGRHSIKVSSVFGHPAIMALTLAVPVPLIFWALAKAKSAAERVCWAMALSAIGAGLLFAYVRAGWAAAILGIAVTAVFSKPARRLALRVLPVVLIVGAIMSNSSLETRALQERLESESSIVYRLQALTVGLQLVQQSPVLGLGLDNYGQAAVEAGWRPNRYSAIRLAVASHSLYLYVLTSAGLLALLPMLAMFGLMLRRSWRVWSTGSSADRDLAAAIMGTLVGYLLFAGTFDSIHAYVASIMLFLIVGAAVGQWTGVTREASA